MSHVQEKNIYFRPDILEKISLIAAENDLTCEEEVIEFLVDGYLTKGLNEKQSALENLDGILQQRVLEAVIQDLKHLRTTVNGINSDTKMLLEFWNHYLVQEEEEKLYSTEQFISAPFQQAEQLIRQRSANNRQKKLDEEVKKTNDEHFS